MPSFLQMSNSTLGSDSPFRRCSRNPSLHSDSSSLHPPQYSRVLMGCSILSMLFQPRPLAVGGGATGASERPFSPNRSLVLLGPDKRGHIVEWVEKTSFARLNKLFEIVATERHYETLLTARNLLAVVRESKRTSSIFSPGSCQRGEEKRGTLRKAPEKKRSASSLPTEAPAKKKNKRKSALNKGKEIKLPTPPKEVRLWTPRGSEPFRPSLLVAGRLALLAEEATSINQPGSPHSDADAAGASCATILPHSAPPKKKWGQKVRVCLFASQAPLPLYREGVCYMEDDYPEGSEVEMAEENPAAPALVRMGLRGVGKEAETDSTRLRCCYAFSKDVRSGRNASSRMAQQHDLFSDLLQTDDYMKAFASQRRNSEEELRLRLEQAEASLSAAREDYEALRVELAEAKSQEELVDARLHETEDEMALLRGEARQLRTEYLSRKSREKNCSCVYQRKRRTGG
ncbi:hypothetical protein CK203_089668 [Vitis vinifera]|uniref:Uncharacterized protein n=1 Tax=Vitis vinifera TaxID=29760 RepID=A0A438EHT4_VITVI|nr:hypothetical protein CK203_089668 [Vitis vinifera]